MPTETYTPIPSGGLSTEEAMRMLDELRMRVEAALVNNQEIRATAAIGLGFRVNGPDAGFTFHLYIAPARV